MVVVGLFITLFGLTCLAASQSKNARVLFSEPPSPARRRALIAAGSALLAASAGTGVAQFGVGVGLVMFCAWLTLAGWAVVLLISWRRQ